MPPASESPMDHLEYVVSSRKTVIQRLALESTRKNGVPDPERTPAKELLPKLDAFLSWLEALPKMDPQLRSKSQIDEGLAVIFKNPKFHFSPVHQEKAKALYERFEADNWGAPALAAAARNGLHPRDGESSEDDDAPTDRPAKRPRSSSTSGGINRTYKPVPPAHPIWGVDGIMHGLARKSGARKVTIIDPKYKHEQRDAKRYGHNGATVGDWFPFQLSALFHGVHGHKQAGIHHGGDNASAYSIVVAAHYDETDIDRGDRLWYSSPGSNENKDQDEVAPERRGTSALRRSLETQNAVRVLRSASGKSGFAPSCGIRYDGLYKVVSCRERRNGMGGLFEQFELERLPGQISLQECSKRPNGYEVRDYGKIERGY